jgi:hypothetical protein
MSCISMDWVKQVLILVVIVAAIFAIFRILIPYVLSQAGVTLGAAGAVIAQVVNIIVWAFVCILVIYIVFILISCLWSFGGGGAGLLPHR